MLKVLFHTFIVIINTWCQNQVLFFYSKEHMIIGLYILNILGLKKIRYTVGYLSGLITCIEYLLCP